MSDPQCDDGFDYDEEPYCMTCDGQGELMACCDDLCHGQGYCIHPDGMMICPVCKGSGE